MKFITVASSKGGIGKTTVALGVAGALKKMGKEVLICDLDFDNACLDILTDSDSVYTIADAANGVCEVADAVVKTESGINLLTAAGLGQEYPDDFADKVALTIKEAAETVAADVVILDTGAGESLGFDIASGISDYAIVVATHSPVSLRSADNTAARLKDAGVVETGLVINSFDAVGVIKYGQHLGLTDLIDNAKVRLLGVVPYDYELVLEAERDKNAHPSKDSESAFNNIAKRLNGENVPIFDGMKKLRRVRRKLF